jgi:ABC-type bacteriocin/lantibiotic exporter with double-glycine peptidase domain
MRNKRIPFVKQMQWSDCGAACLAMSLGFHGNRVRLDEVRGRMGIARDGTSARTIVDTARGYGLRARGLRLEPSALEGLARGSILHWEFNHFVVFDKVAKDGVVIVDPGIGQRTVAWTRFGEAFTGIAIQLEPTDQLGATADGEKRTGPLRRYLDMLLSERSVLGKVVVSSLILRLVALAMPLFVGLVVDRVIPHADTHLLTIAALGLGMALVFDLLTNIIRAHLLLELRAAMDTKLTLGFLEHLTSLPYSFFQQRSTGDLMMRVSSNSTVREILTSNTLSALLDGVLVIFYIGFVFWMSPLIGFIIIALATGQIALFLASRRPTRDLMAEDLEAQAKAQSYMVQLLGGIETLKASGSEPRAVERWSNLFVDEINISLRRGRLSALVDGLRGALERLAPLIVLFLGAHMVIEGTLSLGAVLALNALAAGIFGPLSKLVGSALQLQLLSGYLDRIDDVLEAPREQPDDMRPAHRLGGHIRLDDVSFRYSDSGPLAVDGVSLDIKPGETIAVVGSSGCGKSTLARLVAGLYQPTSGKIALDGHQLGAMELRSVRQQLGMVPQDPFVFASSIRDNISLSWPEAELERVAWAARTAAIHQDVVAMPMGYDTPLADGGGGLSGGQRQRVAIARAVLSAPAVMILDEATSALDTATEARVANNLRRLNCTQIIIAHRLSTVMHADQILVMDKGRVVERGTHSELLSRPSLYRDLVAGQDLGHGQQQGARGAA